MRTTSPEIAYEGLINVVDNLYDVVRDFVKEHQGEKGYINTNIYDEETDNDGNDIIYGVEYCDEHEMGEEHIIFGVRVKNDFLQVLMLPNWDEPTNESYENEDMWDNVQGGISCYYLPTIINLAECIEEYV